MQIQTPFLQNRRKLYSLIAVLILIPIAFGLYLILNNGPGKNYGYKAFDSYKLSSYLNGAAISLDKPTEIGQKTRNVAIGHAQAYLAQDDPGQDAQNKLAYIGLSSNQSALAASDSYLSSLNEVYADKNHQDYQKLTDALKTFVMQSTDGRSTIELKDPRKFTNKNITGKAWAFKFHGSSSDKKIRDVEGTAVLVVGDRTFYYLAVGAPKNNWQGNQDVWDKILGSLKIDQ